MLIWQHHLVYSRTNIPKPAVSWTEQPTDLDTEESADRSGCTTDIVSSTGSPGSQAALMRIFRAAPPNGYPPYMPPGQQGGGFRPPPMMGMPPPTLQGMPPPTLNPVPGSLPPFPPGQGGFRPPMPGTLPNFPPTRPPMPGFQGTPGSQGLGAPSPGNMPPFSPGQMPTPGMNLPGRPGFSPHGGPGMGTPGGFDPNNAGLPRPPHMAGIPGGSQNPNFVRAVKTTKVFIGGIPNGVTDAILTGLIHVSPSSCYNQALKRHPRRSLTKSYRIVGRRADLCTPSTGSPTQRA